MNIVRHTFLLGLVGLLAGCVTPTDMGYVLPPEPAYTAPVSTAPVYNASPAYYPTPVSGYSTLTVYDGYRPVYRGPHRLPHRHRRPPPPPHWHRPRPHGRPHPRVPGRGVPPGKGGGRKR